MMDEALMHEVARANQLANDLAITQANLESLRASIIAACAGTGCLNVHELRQRLDKAEADRNVLAEEVMAWRESFGKLFDFTHATANQGALTRAKAMEEMR